MEELNMGDSGVSKADVFTRKQAGVDVLEPSNGIRTRSAGMPPLSAAARWDKQLALCKPYACVDYACLSKSRLAFLLQQQLCWAYKGMALARTCGTEPGIVLPSQGRWQTSQHGRRQAAGRTGKDWELEGHAMLTPFCPASSPLPASQTSWL